MKGSLFAELRHRNVLRAATLYAAGAWLLAQIVTQVGPVFDLPSSTQRWLIVAAVIGFPFAMMLSWFYELTPEGFRREGEVEVPETVRYSTGRKLDFAIIGVLAPAVILLLANQFVLHKDGNAAIDKSIAVLPLLNESGDPQQDYFSDGLSEELISALAQARDLKVIGRNSSFRFRGRPQDDTASIGAKLGVATLLEGTVRKQGNQLRVVASLVKVADGSQLWSQTYDRELNDVFAVQSEIATSVADALKTTLLGRTIESPDKPPSGSLDAYNALLQGRFYAERRNRADYAKAVDSYQRAIRLDPNYAMAYARLAMAEQWFLGWEASREEREATIPKARVAANKAVALAPQSAIALAALGEVQAWSNFDFPAAEVTLKQALALDPDSTETLYRYAGLAADFGRLDEAVAMRRKGLAIEPLNAPLHLDLGGVLLAQGKLAEAEKELKLAIDLEPNAVGCRATLSVVYAKQRRFDAALATAQDERPGFNRRYALAMVYSARGDETKALAQIEEMIRLDAENSPSYIAEIYAFRGDRDQAFLWLDRAFHVHDLGAATIYETPDIISALRDDPRLAEYMKKLGLPDPNTLPSR